MRKLVCLLVCALSITRGFSQTLTSSDLPIIVINTNGGTIVDDPKIIADMGIINNAPGTRNNITDPHNEYDGKIGIEIRGQSSQMFPMKSYSIELSTAAGKSIDQSLFGLPEESDWVLYAPYNEKTLTHNFLAYAMSREMGNWSANTRYVEVVINGDYKGIYVFMEKIKRNSGRVNVPKMAKTDISGDAVTGGYVFSIDKEADAWYSSVPPPTNPNYPIHFSYVYPKAADIQPAQAAYIKSYVDSFENVLNSSNYQDPVEGWRKYADENSFIDFFLVNEVSRNVDGYRISTYFNKDRNGNGGKIKAGPVWDYDIAFRNANYCNGSDTTGWSYQFGLVCPDDGAQPPFWWQRFMTDIEFQKALGCRWKQLRKTTLSLDHLNHLIDSIATLTTEARTRHFTRWPVLGQYVWPNPTPIATTYEGEITTLKTWLKDRMKWLDAHMPDKGDCAVYPPGVEESMIVSLYPNPFTGGASLNIQSREDQTVQADVYDISGRKMMTAKYAVFGGNNTRQLNSAGWAPGVYVVRLASETGEKVVMKVIKQ